MGLSCFFMDILLFFTIIGALIANILIIRHYAKEIVARLSGESMLKAMKFPITNDKGAVNDIMKPDTSGIEFSEESPMTISKDVKFDLEGGDGAIPPGFEEEK